jgi:hypothetical protein
MARYMIQSSHDPTHADCERFKQSIFRAGAHFVANAEWGCADDNHTAWLIVEAENDRDARLIVPPAMRETATVTRLNRFGFSELMAFGQNLAAVAA